MFVCCSECIHAIQDASKLKEIQKAVGLLSMNAQTPKSMEDARRKHYQFWDTQPVPKLGMTFILVFTVRDVTKFVFAFDSMQIFNNFMAV